MVVAAETMEAGVATIRTADVAGVMAVTADAEEMADAVVATVEMAAVVMVHPKAALEAVAVLEAPAVVREILAEVCNLEAVAVVLPARHREVEAGKKAGQWHDAHGFADEKEQ